MRLSMITKPNTYLSPINNLSILDYFIFNIKIIIFIVTVIPLILTSFFFKKFNSIYW